MSRFAELGFNDKTNAAPPRALVFCCLILVCLGSWWWNHNFGARTQIEALGAMNDVPDIWIGFEKTPDLWRDGLKWWHGPWIQDGIGAFRPVSSYLLWIETFVGLRFGFSHVANFGIALLALVSALSCVLAWVWTRAIIPTIVAAILAPTARFWLMGGVGESWLAWYPVHHDLWMIVCLLAALTGWTLWLENPGHRALFATWAAFLVGVLSKEFLYIFPAMALVVALFHTRRTVSLQRALWQVVALFGSVGALFLLRHAVLPDAYNPPPLKRVHFLRRPFLYWFPGFYKYVLTEQWFLPVLALWCVAFPAVWRRLRPQNALAKRYGLPFLLVLGILLIGAATMGIGDGFWYLAEPRTAPMRCGDWVQMMVTLVFLALIWKHRRTQSTIAILGVFMLSYAPVWTYLGWHYTLAGWFIRAALWWPLFALLLQREFLPVSSQKSRSVSPT